MTERYPASVVASVTVPVRSDRAFAVFTDNLADWWPREFTFGEAGYARAGFDERTGGQWYEVDEAGQRTAWGDVLAWEPPSRLAVRWGISPQRAPEPDADHSSLVEVRFIPEAVATRVEVTHSEFERHGEGADGMRAGMASEQGWPGLLARYAACFR